MIDATAFTTDCQRLHKSLVADIAARIQQVDSLGADLRAEHQRARDLERTALSWSDWRDGEVAQAAAGWILACAFVRFLEDNRLIPRPMITGPGERDQEARDAIGQHYREHPEHGMREYLESAFREVGRLPGMAGLFAENNIIWRVGPSADGANAIVEMLRRTDADGTLVHDLTDPEWGTRFLGDLYQDLSELAKKRYALLQTPVFVEEFILDRTLDPAIAEFGLEQVSLIDPACGSGHFLLGAFDRLVRRLDEARPGTNPRAIVQQALDRIAGVDLNPFAVEIARFRLLIAALRAAGTKTLADAPDFQMHLACGDSLLHGTALMQLPSTTAAVSSHHYSEEDAEAADRILGRRYTCVVANPPYITPKDPALNAAYRARYESCHRQYSLGVPFTERLFQLASTNEPGPGYVGQITANSFMKREFGTKLINEYLPTKDLTHIIDTSGVDIPGHGTPTVIMFARNREPVADTIRCVLGIQGEPLTPRHQAQEGVWGSIEALVDRPGSEDEFVSAADLPRERFATHPWGLGAGGAAELQARVERGHRRRLGDLIDVIGRTTHTASDDAFFVSHPVLATHGIESDAVPLVTGGEVRDFAIEPRLWTLFPYDSESGEPDSPSPILLAWLWPLRALLRRRMDFGQTPEERGLRWFDHSMFFAARYRVPLSISFAFVATHNHFALDRGGKVFNRHAPAIKLSASAGEIEHYALLGSMGSSVCCFWLRQTCQGKESRGEEWERRLEHDATKLQRFPLPTVPPAELARCLDTLAQAVAKQTPHTVAERETPTREALNAAHAEWASIRRQMVAAQEELDWRCYHAYELTSEDMSMPLDEIPEIDLGERAFEIHLARRMAAGEESTQWFARHGSTPITEIPDHWPQPYRQAVQARLDLIASDRDIAILERPEHKRRWATEPWEKREQAALQGWLLDRIEALSRWREDAPTLASVAQLADDLGADPEFREVLAVYLARGDYDLTEAITDLIQPEAVPYLAALRYTASGMQKRAEWERVWDLQRAEDRGEDVGTIDPPPRYAKADFQKGTYWTHRGKLDVPKERFIAYPGMERSTDATQVLGWAGWDHRQRAVALAERLESVAHADAWEAERMTPALAGLLELSPWLHQWHETGDGLPQLVDELIDDGARALGLTRDGLAAWRPPERQRRGGRRRGVTG